MHGARGIDSGGCRYKQTFSGGGEVGQSNLGVATAMYLDSFGNPSQATTFKANPHQKQVLNKSLFLIFNTLNLPLIDKTYWLVFFK